MEHTAQTPAELPFFSIAWKSPMSEFPGSYTVSRSARPSREDVRLSAKCGYYNGHAGQDVHFLSAGENMRLSLNVVMDGLPEYQSYYVSMHDLYSGRLVHPTQKTAVTGGRICGQFETPYPEYNPRVDKAGYLVVVSEDETMNRIIGISNPVWVKYLPDFSLQSKHFFSLAEILAPVIGWAQVKVPTLTFEEVTRAVEKIDQWLNQQNHIPLDWGKLFADHIQSKVVYLRDPDEHLRPAIRFTWKTQLMLGTVIETTLTFPGDGSVITASIQQNGHDLGDFDLIKSAENLPFIILTPEMWLKYDNS